MPYTYLKYLILIFLSFLSYQNVRPQLFVDPNDRFLLTIPKIINQYVGKKEPLMIVGGEWNPTFMFFAERRGWQVGSYHAKDEKFVAGCAERTGLRYIFVDKRYMQDSLPYALVYEDTHFKLFMIK